MISPPKTPAPAPRIKRLSVKTWTNGVVTAFDSGRTPLEGLESAGNVYLTQDGTVRPRPSMVRYGPQPTGKVLGEIFEYKKVTGLTTETWMISMQSFGVSRSPSASLSPSASVSYSRSASASRSPSSSTSLSPSSSLSPSASLSPSHSVSASPSPSPTYTPVDYAQIFIARGEDATWTAVSGKYYNDSAEAHYFQIGNKVVIMNGVDNLSYLNISSATVIPFTSVATPSAPTLNADNTAGSGFPITYRVTANSTVGETAASSALTVDTAKDRDLWSGTDNVIINIAAPAGAVSLNVYMGTVAGFEYLIASGIDPATTTFKDDGTFAQDTTRLFPTTNSTAGPKVSRGTNINGRAFLVGDKDNPYLVWFGGDPSFELDFTPVNGGGNQLVGSGSKDLPIAVKSFRDGKGTPQIVVLCQGTNGKGKRFIMSPDSVTIGTTIITFYDVTEDSGQDGTDSPDGIIAYGNSLYYPSRDGFKTTGTKPQLQNVLSTDRISNTIQNDLNLLTSTAMPGAVGLGFEGRLYWSLPVSSTMNSEIWVLDLDRKGAWMKPWSIAADWMWLYNDNSGNTHHLILSENVIYALSYSAKTTDDGQTFLTNGQSGEIYFSDDKRMWVQLLQVVIVILSPQGEINFQITGKTEDSDLQALGEPTTFTATLDTVVAGWGEVNQYITGWGRNAWSKVNLVPTSSSSSTQEVIIEVDETIQWASYSWRSSKAGVDYSISDIIYEFVEVGLLDLS